MRKIAAVGTAIAAAVLAAVYHLQPEIVLRAAMRYERGSADLEEQALTVAGHEIRYLDNRRGGEAVVLVHGFGADKDNWTRFAKHLPGYRVVALDLPGFGQSSRDPDAAYDIASQVSRLRGFTDALGLQSIHLAGNSMGGHLAAAYAAAFTEQVASVALFNAAGVTSPNPSELSALLERGENPLVVRSVRDFDNLLGFVFVEPPFLPGPVKTYFAEQAVRNAAFTEKVWRDLHNRPYPLEPVLGRIRAPALILWGDRDRLLDVSSVGVFAERISSATDVVVLKECGHSPMIERPAETAQVYTAFLRAHPAQR